MRIFFKLIAVVSLLLFATNSFSLIDGQLQVGKRSAKLKSSGNSTTVNATDLKLSAHVDPFFFLPAAFGLFVIKSDYDVDSDSSVFAADKFQSTQIGAEVMGWLPFTLLWDLRPYAKLGYSVLGPAERKFKTTRRLETGDSVTDNRSVVYNETGVHISAGLRWEPIPLVSGLVELDIAQTTFNIEKVEVEGAEVSRSGYGNVDSQSTALLVGVQVGF